MEIHGKVSSHQNIGGQVNTPPDTKEEIHGKVKTSQGIDGGVNTTSAVNGEIDKSVKNRIYGDYNPLYNKPSIENVTLIGNKTLEDLGITRVLYGTTEYWNLQPRLIAKEKTIYVYIDYSQDDQGNDVPGFKLGDGTSYLIDMPFTNQDMEDHIRDNVRHVTQEEKNLWNSKVRCYISADNENNLVFTTD